MIKDIRPRKELIRIAIVFCIEIPSIQLAA
jgi:hypothetical protein